VCDQYTLQGDRFSRAVRGLDDVAVPLEDSLRNMAVIDALVRSADSGRWERPATDADSLIDSSVDSSGSD
jgi:predicted dehydrogenase